MLAPIPPGPGWEYIERSDPNRRQPSALGVDGAPDGERDTRAGRQPRASFPNAWRADSQAPCVFIVAPGGAGKTTLLHRVARSAGHALNLSLGPEDRDPSALESILEIAKSGRDDDRDRRRAPGVRHPWRGRPQPTDRVRRRGSALRARLAPAPRRGPARRAARRRRRRDGARTRAADRRDRRGPSARSADIPSGSNARRASPRRRADGRVPSISSPFTPDWSIPTRWKRSSRSRCRATSRRPCSRTHSEPSRRRSRWHSSTRAISPHIEFGECTRLLGADGAIELLRALDSGAVMHVIELGRRVVPPILRRHLRARAGRPASEIRLPRPTAVARRTGSRIDGPAQRGRARRVRGCAVAAPPRRRRGRSPTPAARAPGARAPRTSEAARLALLVIRESIAPRETTLDALAALERECVARGLDRLGRVVRGAIAAASGLPERVAQGVVDECELRRRRSRCGARLGDRPARATPSRARHERAGDGDGRPPRSPRDSGCRGVGPRFRSAPGRRIGLCRDARPDRRRRDRLDHLRARRCACAHRRGSGARRTHGVARRPARVVTTARPPDGAPATPDRRDPQGHGDRQRHGRTAGARRPEAPASHRRMLRRLPPRARTGQRSTSGRCVRRHERCCGCSPLNSGAPLHRELIADILWGDLGTESAVHALHVSVSSLRRALPAEVAGPAGSLVERVGEAYRLGIVERRDCDLTEFDDRLAGAATAKAEAGCRDHGRRAAPSARSLRRRRAARRTDRPSG